VENGKLPELELKHRAKGHREISLDRHEPKP